MRTRDWFGIGLRVVGVPYLIYGAAYLLDSLLLRLGYFSHPESGPGYYLINGIFHLVVALYLIYGAPLLVSFAYPDEVEDERDVEDEDE